MAIQERDAIQAVDLISRRDDLESLLKVVTGYDIKIGIAASGPGFERTCDKPLSSAIRDAIRREIASVRSQIIALGVIPNGTTLQEAGAA